MERTEDDALNRGGGAALKFSAAESRAFCRQLVGARVARSTVGGSVGAGRGERGAKGEEGRARYPDHTITPVTGSVGTWDGPAARWLKSTVEPA